MLKIEKDANRLRYVCILFFKKKIDFDSKGFKWIIIKKNLKWFFWEKEFCFKIKEINFKITKIKNKISIKTKGNKDHEIKILENLVS